MSAATEKALAAAHKFAKEENWKHATLCMLVVLHADQLLISADNVVQKFSEIGQSVDPDLIYLSLDELANEGLVGIVKSA